MKLLFKPYTKNELAEILFNLYREHLKDFVNQRRKFSSEESKLTSFEEFKLLEEYQLVHPKAFLMAAGKIDKLSGDIRVCFEILRSTVQKKIDYLRKSPTDGSNKIGICDVNEVIIDLYESKLLKMIKKLPRTHVIFLQELVTYLEKKPKDVVGQQELLVLFNSAADRLMIGKITQGEMSDIVQTLSHCDILV